MDARTTYLYLARFRASRHGEATSERGKGPAGVTGPAEVLSPSHQGSIVCGRVGRAGATGECCKSALLKEGVVVLVRFWVGN